MALLVEGDRIARIAPEAEIARGRNWKVLDASGHTVIPGLIDAHVHLMDGGRGLVLSAQLGHRPEPTCRPPAQPRHDARRGKAEGQSAKLEAQP